MKKKALAVLLAGLMVIGIAACGSQGKTQQKAAGSDTASGKSDKKSGFVVGFSNGYWGNTWRAQMVEDFENQAKEYKKDGVLSDYMVSNTNSDATEQLNQINAMIDKGVDAIMIDAVSPTTIKAAVEKAQKKGILVVIANDPAAYKGTVCVCGNNYSWQKIQAAWMADQLKGKGNIVEISGVSGNAADTLRVKANEDVLGDYPDIKILGSAPGNWSETDAQSVMTTFLSSYHNIDGVLAQDVMGEGIIKAYENAGKTPKVMTGDYTKSFFAKWASMPDLETIGVSYAPGSAVTALDVTVRLLQGKTIKEDQFVANPMDEKMKNTIMLDPPYVVTKKGDQNAAWMKGLSGTKAITLDKAMELLKDSADTAALDGWLTQEEVDKFFN